MSTVLVVKLKGGRKYEVEVPASYRIPPTTKRGMLVTPSGSFSASEVVSATVEREGAT